MDGQETTHGRICPSQFLAEQGIAYIVHARSTVLRFNWSGQEAQFAHTLDQVYGEFTFFIRYTCRWRYFLLCELARLRLDTFLCGCQFKVHMRFSLSICIQHGETFYFDQRLILEKARDLKKGFCGIIIPVAHKDSDFRNILHLAARGFDNALQVAKRLFKLGYQVSGGDNLTFSIAAGLPGEEEEMALCYKDTMTEAPGA